MLRSLDKERKNSVRENETSSGKTIQMESNKKAQNNVAGRAADSHRQKQQS